MKGLYRSLYPLAMLYNGITKVRNYLFDMGMLEQWQSHLPTIVVGNLAVGGTGKTPHVEYLLRLLLPTYRTATLSRGYGRRTKDLREVTSDAHPDDVGDEPLQMKQRFPNALVVVDANRRRGLRWIAEREAQVALLDDAFQHRYVRAGLSILLTDYTRRYTHDFLLPMGRLREARKGAERADIIIVTKCPPHLSSAEQQKIVQELQPLPSQQVFFTCNTYGVPLPLHHDAPPYRPATSLVVLTGIAHPEPLMRHFQKMASVVSLRFPDHHRFTTADLQRIEKEVKNVPQVITTEKDAVRLRPLLEQLSVEAQQKIYVQPIEVAFLCDQSSFNEKIKHYVSTYQRNR